LQSFGREHYSQVAYLNFEEMPLASQLFQADLTPQRIITEIGLLLDISITPGNTLIILDEIQACPEALNSLKYFFENANEYHVATAGQRTCGQLEQYRRKSWMPGSFTKR